MHKSYDDFYRITIFIFHMSPFQTENTLYCCQVHSLTVSMSAKPQNSGQQCGRHQVDELTVLVLASHIVVSCSVDSS